MPPYTVFAFLVYWFFCCFRKNSEHEPDSTPSQQQQDHNEKLKTIVGKINDRLERHPDDLDNGMVEILRGLASNLGS